MEGARRLAVSDTITLNGIEVELTSDLGRAFIVDATRAAESVISDSDLLEKYDLSIEELQAIANTKAVGRAIRNEREYRLRSGISTRELAAKSYFKAPTVLDKIMSDEQANARHRIEACREIRQVAVGTGDDNRPSETEKFIIRIDLTAGGGEVEQFDVTRKINAGDVAPDEQSKLSAPKLVIDNEKFDE
jgi:hypothetical protein